mmetsp:Transcript_3317/g.5030  ORF Transcript_3317/g.5030 Transcript_3317/m.5030 type:complete len:161 (+) Transcript_3317:88-570(+)
MRGLFSLMKKLITPGSWPAGIGNPGPWFLFEARVLVFGFRAVLREDNFEEESIAGVCLTFDSVFGAAIFMGAGVDSRVDLRRWVSLLEEGEQAIEDGTSGLRAEREGAKVFFLAERTLPYLGFSGFDFSSVDVLDLKDTLFRCIRAEPTRPTTPPVASTL